jgi:arylsulfatase A-like enzyme
VDPNQPENLQYYSGKSGTHRDDGIFLALGAGVRPGHRIDTARIIDLAPTILHLLGVPVPDDMDGRVLQEVLSDDCQRHPVVERPANEPAPQASCEESAYSTEEEQVISDRLRALGYVE